MVYEYGKWLPCSPCWAYSTVCLSIRQLMDNTWMVYSLWLLWVMLLWTLVLHGLNIFSVYGYIQKREIAASYGYSIFNFWGTDKPLLQIELPYDPAIPLLGIHTEESRIERDTCTPVFITALFIIARTWKQPSCPSTDKWIRKLWNIHTMEYYSAIKKNLLSFSFWLPNYSF